MKKFILAIFMILLSANVALAADAGTWTIAYDSVNPSSAIKTITFSWTAAADGTVEYTIPATYTSGGVTTKPREYMEGYYIYWVETNPGSTAPTDNYDIVLNSSGGADLFRSKLINRDEANTEVVKGLNVPCDGTAMTFVISNNAVNAATGTIKLYLAR